MQVHDALWSFEPLPTIPAIVRERLAGALHGWGVAPSARENATLVLNELVSNVVEHAGTMGEVHVRYDGDVVAFRVIDFSPRLPHHATAPSSARRSGLDVVAALSRDWGYVLVPGGKTVWAVVDARPEERS